MSCWDADDWPRIVERVMAADILVLGSPIWLGNTTFMTWNLLHLARIIKDAGGIPAHGNQRAAWDAGERFDFAPARSAGNG